MGKTTFNISFIDNNDKCDQIVFVDSSEYNTDVEVKTPIVKVLYPDHSNPISLSYTPRSTNIIKVPCLDGLYTVELSVCPNDKLKETFYYFQLCSWNNKLKSELCKYSGNKTKVKELMDLWLYSKAIKEVVKDCPEKANIMFNYINNQLC